MKNKTLIKVSFRDIKNSLGRFISLVVIIGLGVAFFTGLKITPKDMKYTADDYFTQYGLRDIELVSTLGLTEEDLESIKAVEGVEFAEGKYTKDFLANIGDKELVVKVHDYDEGARVNKFKLVEGRYPENPDEIAVELGNFGSHLEIGDSVKLHLPTEDVEDFLSTSQYKVVGKVQTPNYLSFEKGRATIGNGSVSSFAIVPRENFNMEVFTEVDLLVKGAEKLNSYEEEYFKLIDPVFSSLEDLKSEREFLRYEEIIKEGQEELDDAKIKYDEGKLEGEEKLKEALDKIEEANNKIISSQGQLEKSKTELRDKVAKGRVKIEEEKAKLQVAEADFKKADEEFQLKYDLGSQALEEAKNEMRDLEEGKTKLESDIENIDLMLATSEDLEEKGRLESTRGELERNLNALKAGIESGKEEINKSTLELEVAKRQIDTNRSELTKAFQTLETEEENLNKLESDNLKKIEAGREELESKSLELLKGRQDYDEEKEKFEKELAEAKLEIQDGEKKLRDIEKGKWYILDREKHYSYMDYKGAADRIHALSKVFPVFFALVAGLVCLTTMSRMVDEQRTTIGILKAIGYKKKNIRMKYLIYGLTASLLGISLGIIVGYSLFPVIIYNAYNILYVLPEVKLQFNMGLAIMVSLGVIGLISGTIYFSTREDLLESPSSLMRPKAPKIGKKILLERIPVLWDRLKFSHKVTLRNIFRYKQRFLMTVLGVAGCTALMIAGFGIKDSIMTIVDKQYGEIFKYDLTIGMESSKGHILDDYDIEKYTFISSENAKVLDSKKDKEVTIVVPENKGDFQDFVSLRTRANQEDLALGDGRVIITDQIAQDYRLKPGDILRLQNDNKDENDFVIAGISENYTNNYIYMEEDLYVEKFYNKPDYTMGMARLKDNVDIDKLVLDLMKNEEIESISNINILKDDFLDTINSLNYVVLVMIVFAGALAFVVLYNLTNVNISERIREIATIKVLGFYDGEVAAYIYRENTILTLFGIVFGFLIGKYLHRYIMVTVEMENIMFGLKLNVRSNIIAGLMTVIFSILVNLFMYYKLKNVQMVESLKSVE